MTTMAKLQKMSTQSIAKMQALVEHELARREDRMNQLSEVRKYIESAAKQFGLAAEEVIEMFKIGKKAPAKKGAKRRGRPPSKKTAVATKVGAKRRGRPPLAKNVAKLAKSATKKVASKKKVAAKKSAKSSARSAAMKEAWARRKAAAAAAGK
jgi:hypothetical protein